jgi:EspG family
MALTTTVGGVWALQALLGIETMPYALRLKPFVPSAHASLMVKSTAGDVHLTRTAEYLSLVAAGAIDARGNVDEAVRDWMTVIGRPERQVILAIRRPNDTASADPGAQPTVRERVMVVCLRQRWLAMIARDENDMVIDAVGESADPATQIDLICHTLLPALGDAPAADIEGVNLPVDTLTTTLTAAAPHGRAAMASALARLGLAPQQVDVVTAAARLDESAMGVISIVDQGIKPVFHPRVVTIADTDFGRISVTTTVGADGRTWMSIWPAGHAALREDVGALLSAPRAA